MSPKHAAEPTASRAKGAGSMRRGLIVAAAIAMMAVAALMCAFGSWYLGISSTGPYDETGAPIWYDEDAQSEYDQLADALLSGRLSLSAEPPQWLQEMDNPYDTEARDALEEQTDEDYLWDTAYHDGSYYVYFGVIPCLVFYVPFHLITGGASLPTGIPVLLCLWLYLAGLAALTGYAARHLFGSPRRGPTIAVFAGAAAASALPFAFMSATLYQIPVVSALALAAWGLYFWLRAYREGRTGFLLAGAVCVAAIFGCRPTLGIVALLGIFPLVRVIKTHRGAKLARDLCALALPFVVVASGLAWYNAARFGSPLDFGSNYNLTAVDLSHHGYAADRIWLGLWNYLLQPPAFSTTFPFLQPADLGAAWNAGNYVEAMGGGLLACFPFLWLAAGGFALRGRKTCQAVIAILFVSGVVLCVLDAEVGGMVGRYQLDFAFLFALAAAMGALGALQRSHDSGSLKAERVMGGVVVAAAALAVVFAIVLVLFLTTKDSCPSGVDYASINPLWSQLLS